MKKGDKVTIEFTITELGGDTVMCQTKSGGKFGFSYNSIEPPFEPRVMLVWNSKEVKVKRKVLDKWRGYFVADMGLGAKPILYMYAEELPKELEPKKITDEYMLKTFQEWLNQKRESK